LSNHLTLDEVIFPVAQTLKQSGLRYLFTEIHALISCGTITGYFKKERIIAAPPLTHSFSIRADLCVIGLCREQLEWLRANDRPLLN
jgi:hypothetical protein